jgi:hypothetical protein
LRFLLLLLVVVLWWCIFLSSMFRLWLLLI